MRGFVLCGDCGKPLTSCWSKSKTGTKHPYYMCDNKTCGSYYKSIRPADLANRFTDLIATVQPSETMLAIATNMFRRAWDHHAERLKEARASLRRRMTEI